MLPARLTLRISRPMTAWWPSPNSGEKAMNVRLAATARAAVLALMALLLFPATGSAQTTYAEDFTGATSNNQWFFYNGACLTAGSNTSTTSPGYIPGCATILSTYYNQAIAATQKPADSYLTGGDLGYLGGSSAPGSISQQVPDSLPSATNGNTGGALRFTNGYPYGYHENGAIVSNFVFPTNQGLQITFKTVTYHGDNQGGHGADGISFYLLDGCMPIAGGTVPAGCAANSAYGTNSFPGIGAWGGSLAYTCSNSNSPFDGLSGGYLGLGIDEYGNFLNGTSNTLGETGTTASGDNTASGGGYQPGRIGLRGAGNISWATLNSAYGTNNGSSAPYYPASLATSCTIDGAGFSYDTTKGTCMKVASNGQITYLPTDAMWSVQKTCAQGKLYNYSSVSSPTAQGDTSLTNTKNTAGILDYAAIANAYKVITSFSIANESANIRGSTLVANTSTNDANPITYKLKITPNNLLSLSFSYNGGVWQPVISGQSITASNGSLPSYFRFGFAGSTGGSTNVHEVMCFKAAPNETSNSSGGVNVYQNPTVKTGTQVYLAYYFPSDWTGQLTATNVLFDTTLNKVVVSSAPTWDARCVLTGVTAATGPCSTGVTSQTAEAPSSRVMLTWNGSAGVPLQYSSLSSTEQTNIDSGDATATANRVNYLRGDRTNELSSSGTCPQLTSSSLPCFRSRSSVLGDIVDSSPTWVGPPQIYNSSVTWTDGLYPSQTPAEQSVSYQSFITAKQSRANVVYIGANDGFVHGFRAGALDASGNMVTTTTPNDGQEVLAYMPAAVLNSIHSSTPDYDFANQQYSHAWFVDATPAMGDVLYSSAWHTWLVGGIGAGGKAIYALDVTDPSNFSESNAASIVIGEWGPNDISCTNNVSNCGRNLGYTYGTPLIRRFHNGSWGAIFGNGYGAQNNNAAGIFIMLVNPSSGAITFYYLATPNLNGNTANGIASPASLDMDMDHITDYIYAGDLQGHVWRFDVTDKDPTKWAVSSTSPLFTTPSGQPITAGLTVGSLRAVTLTNLGGQLLDTTKPQRIVINFGTGQQTPQSLTQSAQYATGQQYLFGIWDWDFNAPSTATQPGWNSRSSLKAIASSSATAPSSLALSNLQQQTITTTTPASGSAYRTVTNNVVCWAVVGPLDYSSSCPNPGTKYGWYIALPSTQEQVIFNPILSPDGELVVNTYIPAQDSPLSCNAATSGTGFTMGVAPGTGSGQTSGTPSTVAGFFQVNTNSGVLGVDGVQLNGTGIPWFLNSGQKGDNNAEYLITQTSSGAATSGTNSHTLVMGKRVNWVQRR
jgi:type IV pilus assembly protein PilY1